MSSMHKATFHTETGDVLFFKTWVIHGKKETYFACLALVALGILYQAIKFARLQYGRKCKNLDCKQYVLSRRHLLQTAMHMIQFVWGYAIMLAVMTYNAWIMVAAISGFGIGYFFFGWGEYEDNSAVLHINQSGASNDCGKQCRFGVSTSDTQQELLLLRDDNADDMVSPTSTSSVLQCQC